MINVAQRLYEEALTLPIDTRADLAALLIESLDAVRPDAARQRDDEVDAAWREEIGRRIAALDAGQVRPIPWEQAEEMIFGDLGASQSPS